MRGNRVTAISGCGCGDVPPLAPNTSATTAAPSAPGTWGPWAVIGGAVVGAMATSWATGTPFVAKGKEGLVLGLGAVLGAGGGYLIAKAYGGAGGG